MGKPGHLKVCCARLGGTATGEEGKISSQTWNLVLLSQVATKRRKHLVIFMAAFQLSTQDRAAFPDAPAADECHTVPSGTATSQ